MAKKPTTRQMSDAQEEHIAEVFGVRRTRGSGNQFRDQMDDRGHRMDEAVALAFDGKSTLGDSIGIKKSELDKADEQAYGEAPVMAYRFYDDWTLRNFQDRYLLTENTLLELVQRSRTLSVAEASVRRFLETGNEDDLDPMLDAFGIEHTPARPWCETHRCPASVCGGQEATCLVVDGQDG